MKTKTIRQRVLKNLGKIQYSADVFQIFSEEQKKGRRPFLKFWKRLQTEENLLAEILFSKRFHLKLAGPTFDALIYAFAKAYYVRTDNEHLKNYANALMGKFEAGYTKFDDIIRQKEMNLIDHILSDISVGEMCENHRTQLFMRQAMTLLVLASEMKYDAETENIIDHLLDEFEEGRAKM